MLEVASSNESVGNGPKVAFEPVRACWVCGGGDLVAVDDALLNHPQFVKSDPELAAYTGQHVRIMRCKRCGFGQPEALPSLPNYFERMYSLRWDDGWMDREFASDYKDMIFSRILDGLERRLPSSRRSVIDIGAHVGRFIHLAKKRGFLAEGIELNPQTAAFAAATTGLSVHRINAHDLSLEGRRYDAVTITDVLEHIPVPVAVLKTLNLILSPGGWIAVKVPHGPAQLLKEHLRARLQRGYHPAIADNLLHVNQFSVKSLALALEQSGFTNVSVEIGAPELIPTGRPALRRLAINASRLAAWRLGNLMPGGIRSPLGLHLQAFAQRTR